MRGSVVADYAVRTRPAVPAKERRNADERNLIMTTRVGLRFPDQLAYDRWKAAGFQIVRAVDSLAWCLGDWLVYGQQHYASRYQHAIELVGLDYQTLRNYAWVARRIELHRRRSALSFQHHAEVASMSDLEQDKWLT